MKALDVDSLSPNHLGQAFFWKGLSYARSEKRLFKRRNTDVFDKIQERYKFMFVPNLVDKLWETKGARKA